MSPNSIPPAPPLTVTAAEPIEVASSVEPWSEYRLADGTVIRARLRVVNFLRWTGHYDVKGVPVYSNQTEILFDVTAPPELMEK
jgi:hypothetical protein